MPRPVLKTKQSIQAEKDAKEIKAKAKKEQEEGDGKDDATAERVKRQLQEKREKEAIFPVSVHQVVGMFNLDNERPPPNLDCGLFEWKYFHEMSRPRESVSASDANKRPNTQQKDDTWSYPGATSISTYKRELKKNVFQMKILGNSLSRERMLKVLPKKVQIWIGLIEEYDD